MSEFTNGSYPVPWYPTGHPNAPAKIPRDNCTSCTEPLVCAGFYSSNASGSNCDCGCPWHEHQSLVTPSETLVTNTQWQRGACVQSKCRQYFTSNSDWGLRPPCVCGKPWQSHRLLEFNSNSSSTAGSSQVRSLHTTSWPAPSASVLPDRLPVSRASGPPPTFSGFSLQHGVHSLSRPGPTPLIGPSQPIPSSDMLMSANFIRQFRARSDYASVPPDRRFLSSRALAPKSISPSRAPASISALRHNIQSRGRGEQANKPAKAWNATFDIAFIPFPLPSPTVTVPSQADRGIKLLDPERHERLLQRLQTMGFLFSIELSLSLEGSAFINDLNAKVIANLTAAGVTLPPRSPQQSSLDFPLPSTEATSISLLTFRLLQAKRIGSPFTVTTETGPFNLEKLSKAPFGSRIANLLRPTRFLLFIAPSYGLPVMRCSINNEVRESLRLPTIPNSSMSAVSAEAHACIGLRLFNGFVNNGLANEAAWACVPGCTPSQTDVLSPQYVPSSDEDEIQEPFRRAAEIPPRSIRHRAARPNEFSIPAGSRISRASEIDNRGSTEASTLRPRLNQNQRVRVSQVIELSDSPSPPPEIEDSQPMQASEFIATRALTDGRQVVFDFLDNIQESIRNPQSSLKLTASTVDAAVDELMVVLLATAADHFKFDRNERHLMIDAVTKVAAGSTASNTRWSTTCSVQKLLHHTFSVTIRNSTRSQSDGHGIRKIVLSSLVARLTESDDGLWQHNSQGLRTLRTTERVVLPPGFGSSSPISQTSKAFRARAYAAGLSVLLLLCHARLPSSITPILLAIALLPATSRPKVATPSFLQMLFEQPSDKKLIKLLQDSSHLVPMNLPLCSLMEAAGVPSHSKLLSQPRDESIHEWLLYRAVVSFYGVTGVTNPKEEDVEINAFIAGIREQELVTGTRVSKHIPTNVHDVLSMVLAIYDRKITNPQVLLDRIAWNFSPNGNIQAETFVRDRLISFIGGTGVPPLCAFSVPQETLALAGEDPCYRAKRLLAACTSSPCRPFNDAGTWITVDFEVPPPNTEFSELAHSFRYHSCLGSVTIYFTPILRMLAETPAVFDAFVFRNIPDMKDFTGEWWDL